MLSASRSARSCPASAAPVPRCEGMRRGPTWRNRPRASGRACASLEEPMSDPITETDLLAYVDDQLDPARRIEVEEHLAQNPDAATRVMADLKDRDTLRLIHAAPLPRPAEAMIKIGRASCRER